MPYVYMLRCADDTLYTGWTTDIEARVRAHNEGRGAKYTRARRPVRLAWCQPVEDRSCALREEYRIRHLKRCDKDALIRAFLADSAPDGKETE